MWIHNTSQGEKIYQGRPIAADSFFLIPDNLLIEYQNDAELLSDLLNEQVKISLDGINDYVGDGIIHINLLKKIDIEPRDADGAKIQRLKVAKAGWNAQFHAIRVSTATPNGVHNKNKAGDDLGFCTYTMYDAQDAVTTDPTTCVKTVVTWEPMHDMELVGVRLFQKSSPSQDVWLYVTAAAHIPAQYEGSVEFLQGGMNLSDVADGGEVDFDGRASKFIAYDATHHSGRFEILIKHPVNFQHSFSLVFELFKP